MKRLWNNLPIGYKLFLPLFGTITVIIIALLSYLWGYESNLMLKKEQHILHTQSLAVAKNLHTHMDQLKKETLFLSHLEVMDDIVAHDMDRRITNLLEQKANDLGESISLFVITPDFTIQAASSSAKINTVFTEVPAIRNSIQSNKPYLFLGENLYFFRPLYGSFSSSNFLGYLVMSYPLKNFTFQLQTNQNLYRWLTPPKPLNLTYESNPPSFDQNAYLHDAIGLDGMLEGWIMHYAMPKNETLALLYHFQTLFLSTFGISLALIGFLVWVIVLRIIKPLRELSDTAMNIALTGDYNKSVTATGNDEIGTLAYSFNALMFTTQKTMRHLELEREKYGEKLVSLIVFFNAITRTDTKEETVEIAMSEIRRFSGAQEVYFALLPDNSEAVTIALDAVGNETPGYIVIEEPTLRKESNERFYAALERMLALQMERIELLEKKQSALRAKSAFLSAMSHELRTPLGSILSLSQYQMIQPDTPEPLRETFEKIENSAYHLLGVINNILDFAKAESGKMEPHLSECDPVTIIKDSLDLVAPLIDDKGLKLTSSYHVPDVKFNNDERLLRQVIINLLSNAIKYTDEGSIDVTLRFHNGEYRLEIKDTGCGIAPEAAGKLFDEFYQVQTDSTRAKEGSGLGLAISKRIARLLHGDLLIFSEGENRGTTALFNFRSF